MYTFVISYSNKPEVRLIRGKTNRLTLLHLS